MYELPTERCPVNDPWRYPTLVRRAGGRPPRRVFAMRDGPMPEASGPQAHGRSAARWWPSRS